MKANTATVLPEFAHGFCAACITGPGPFTQQPMGKNDSLVLVCKRCSEVEVADPESGPRPAVLRTSTYSATRTKANRDRLTQAGLCMYGRNHGPATSGRLCADCRIKQRGRGGR